MRTSHFFTAVLAFANFAQATQLQTHMMAQVEANTDLGVGFLGLFESHLQCTQDKGQEVDVENSTYFNLHSGKEENTFFTKATSAKHKKVKTAIHELYTVLHITTPFDENEMSIEEEKAYGIDHGIDEDEEPRGNGYFELDHKESCLDRDGLKSAGGKYNDEIVKAIEKLQQAMFEVDKDEMKCKMIKVGGKEVYATRDLKRLDQSSFTVWKDEYFSHSLDDIFSVEDKEGKRINLDAL